MLPITSLLSGRVRPVVMLGAAVAAALAGCGGASPFEPQPAASGAPATGAAQPAALTADPARGERLFAAVPAAGQLACMDCHSDDPLTKNFGNIWVGRNAPSLIERAVNANTGGMGYFARYLDSADLADIAAYLGTTPQAITFPAVSIASAGAVQTVTVRASTKAGIDSLGFTLEGDFSRSGGDCGEALARFSSCTVELRFAPRGAGVRDGALLIHTGDPNRPVRIPLTGSGVARAAEGASRHA